MPASTLTVTAAAAIAMPTTFGISLAAAHQHRPACGTPGEHFPDPARPMPIPGDRNPQGEHHGGQVAAVPVAQRDSGPLPRTGSTRSTPAQPIPPVSIASDPTNPSNTGSDRRQDPFPVGAEAAARWGTGLLRTDFWHLSLSFARLPLPADRSRR